MSEASPAYTNRHCMKINIQKKARCLGVLLQLAIAFNAAGQISISPEVGLSYFPFGYGFTEWRSSETIDFLIGVSGIVPIQEQWYVNARVSYVPRKNLAWDELGFTPWLMSYRYEHNDLNIDFSINRKLFNRLHIGMGPSIIRKMNTLYSMTYIYEDGSEELAFSRRLDRFDYGFSATVGIELKGCVFKVEYYLQVKDNYRNYRNNFVGSNRYNAVIAYPIQLKNR